MKFCFLKINNTENNYSPSEFHNEQIEENMWEWNIILFYCK